MPAFIEILRPRQWLKNGLVFVGLLFALPDRNQSVDLTRAEIRVLVAFVMFCLASSIIYIINDFRDREADRLHPEKKARPIASGRLSQSAAIIEAVVLALILAPGVVFMGDRFGYILTAYLFIQLTYTLLLKNLVLVDVFVIAFGFVLRVYAGTVAAGVSASSWLLLCTFSVALFIILCKRYDERMMLGADAAKHRKVLAHYEPQFLAHIITATAALTILCYAIYTLSPGTVAKFGHERLVATVPFVVFGIYRYCYLVFCKGEGGRPERLVTTDLPTIINFLLYALTSAIALSVKG